MIQKNSSLDEQAAIEAAEAAEEAVQGSAFRHRNAHLMTAGALSCLENASLELDTVLEGLETRDQQLFRLRLARWFQNLYDGLLPVYGQRDDFDDFMKRLVKMMAQYYIARPEELKVLDVERDLQPDWFQHESMLG